MRDSIRADQQAAGVHVMGYCHALGFLDRRPATYMLNGRDPQAA